MFNFGFKRKHNSVPRAGLLLYLGRPNLEAADVPLGDDTEIGDDTIIRWMFLLPADADIRSATGWISGVGNIFYDTAGDPIAVLASEIAAWASINQWNVLFHLVSADTETGRLAIYSMNTPLATLNKALRVLREDQIDLTSTAYFNGVFTPAQITAEGGTYTGGPTVFADNLGALQTAPSGMPALQGMRLATTLADGAVLGPELVADYSASKWLPQGSNLVSQDGTAVKITYVDHAYGAKLYLKASTGFLVSTATPLLGVRLLVGFKAKINMGEARSTVSSDSSGAIFLSPTSLTNAFTDYSVEFTNNDIFDGWIAISFRDLSAGEVVWITDISVKKVIPTYCDTTITGTPLLPSVQQPTRTFDVGFTTSVPGPTYKKYTRTNPAIDLPGYLCEPARTNYARKSAAPATHTTDTAPVGTYTLWQAGTGSITATAGTAVGTFGTASNGTPATITITTAGTVVLTASGTNTWVQLELGAFATSQITTTSAAVTRQGTVLSFPTSGKIRPNNMAFLLTATPMAGGQNAVGLFNTRLDSGNGASLVIYPTSILFESKIGGVGVSATCTYTHVAGRPIEIIFIKSTLGNTICVRAYNNGWGSFINGSINETSTAKSSMPIGTIFQLGALNGASQFAGNLSELDTLLIPDGIADPLAWAKQQWGLLA